jgi:hypothetical protein
MAGYAFGLKPPYELKDEPSKSAFRYQGMKKVAN